MASKPLTAPTRKPIRLAPVRPNAGVQAAYQKKLDALIALMGRDIQRQVAAAWRDNPPRMAQDETPAGMFRRLMRELGRKWLKQFADFAAKEAPRFTRQATGSADRSFAASLRKAGFTVKFTLTPEVRDVLGANVAENVSLIRSIPSQYLTQVEGIVMRGVQVGRDMFSISTELHQQLGVETRRAAFIARDQCNKSTAAIVRTRQDALGITQAQWLHSAGGRQPRPTHVANSGKPYDVREGWPDPALGGKRIWPGTEINCRCVSRSIIPGLSND